MKRIREKLNKKGFTLAELLIVVAIIAVLVAVSVPVFNSKLERAREATDIANMRAAKVEVTTYYVNGDITLDDSGKATVYYDADNGIIVTDKDEIKTAYGQGTKVDGKSSYTAYDNESENHGKIIEISLEANKDGTVTDEDSIKYTYEWVDLATKTTP